MPEKKLSNLEKDLLRHDVQKSNSVDAGKNAKAGGFFGFLRKNEAFLLGGVIILLALAWVFFFFLPNTYTFSFTDKGVTYVSNEITPTGFYSVVRDSNSFVVSVDSLQGASDPWATNAANLWLVALNSSGKRVVLLVRNVDSFGGLQECHTNDGNLLANRLIGGEECRALLNNGSSVRVGLHYSNDNRVVLYKSGAEVFAQRGEAMTITNYSFIKNIYPNFDQTLAVFNERLNAVGDLNIK